jgi:uncharacterized protein (DUF1499 family)
MLRRSRVTNRGWARRPQSLSPLALLGFAVAVSSLVALALAGLGSRWGWWHFGTGFQILRWGAYGGIAAVLLSLAGVIHGRPGAARRGFTLALLGVVGGVIAVGVPWQWRRVAQSVPPIHDITTDTRNPPEFSAVLPLRADAPNPTEYAGAEIAALQAAAYPDIQPMRLDVSPDIAFARSLAAARSLGWEIVEADPDALRLEATDRTYWFGFADDVVVRITPVADGSRIDVRSLSRVGGSDVGTNARRIRRFLERVRQY